MGFTKAEQAVDKMTEVFEGLGHGDKAKEAAELFLSFAHSAPDGPYKQEAAKMLYALLNGQKLADQVPTFDWLTLPYDEES
jgi:hypothetical protein